MQNFTFIKTFFSPFKRPKIKWYIGRVKIGTPYFLPRRWKNPSHKEARKLALKEYREWGLKMIENSKLKSRSYQYFYDEIMRSKISVPKKIGFDFVDLGWKTKWSAKDYRFEWSPLISFVFFKWQIAVIFLAVEENQYWESWLYYEYSTDKTKSKQERVDQCRKEAPQIWTRNIKDKVSKTIDYYDLILKKKYNTKQ